MPYADPEKAREYNREYQRKWARENRDKRRVYEMAWNEANREKRREIARQTKLRHPERKYAQNTLRRAVLAGKIERQPCEVCGDVENVHAHHDDYAKPLEVRWLCRSHHNEVHRVHP